MEKNTVSATRYLIVVASFIIVVAGLRAAKSLVVPFLLATFFAIILSPWMHLLRKKGLPGSLALTVIIAVCIGISGSVSFLIGSSINQFRGNLSNLPRQIDRNLEPLREQWLPDWSLFEEGTETVATPDSLVDANSTQNPTMERGNGSRPSSKVALPERSSLTSDLQRLTTDYFRDLLSGLANMLSNAFIIIITVAFMLLEAYRFPGKLAAALGHENPALDNVEQIVSDVRRYMVIKSTTSALTGILVFGLLTGLEIPYPFLWGVLAFLFNFVPNIGSIIASIPAVLLALISDDPIMKAMLTAVGYVSINCFISYAIEPRYMGQGLGLSTLVVFLSLVFWGWVLGPVGMLLSAPLTMIVKIILENSEDFQWIAVLMGSKAPETSGD
ncbi:MAG: AI-2E family transporter [Pirellulaceae bacterium]|nr:AI-2E family transporter [Pirellulaceae bacterium]